MVVLEAVTQLIPPPQLQPTSESSPTVLPLIELPSTPTPTTAAQGFGDLQFSADKVYYRSPACGPKELSIQIDLGDSNAYSVVLFIRLEDMASGEKTEWTAIPMNPVGGNTFGYNLSVERDVPEFARFSAAYMHVQIVATNSSGAEIGRTSVDSSVQIESCSG